MMTLWPLTILLVGTIRGHPLRSGIEVSSQNREEGNVKHHILHAGL